MRASSTAETVLGRLLVKALGVWYSRTDSHRSLEVQQTAGKSDLGVVSTQRLLQDLVLLVHERSHQVGVVTLVLGDEQVSLGKLLIGCHG